MVLRPNNDPRIQAGIALNGIGRQWSMRQPCTTSARCEPRGLASLPCLLRNERYSSPHNGLSTSSNPSVRPAYTRPRAGRGTSTILPLAASRTKFRLSEIWRRQFLSSCGSGCYRLINRAKVNDRRTEAMILFVFSIAPCWVTDKHAICFAHNVNGVATLRSASAKECMGRCIVSISLRPKEMSIRSHNGPRACPQLSQMTAAAKWIPARKFLAVLS